MNKGGQNEFIAAEPVAYPCPMDILRDMYTGVYSAVIGISKMFYYFLTTEQDRRYLGLIPSTIGKHYCYEGFSMDAASLPGVTTRKLVAVL
eukprot:15351000-Ditylum_brightwellii.AAC.1